MAYAAWNWGTELRVWKPPVWWHNITYRTWHHLNKLKKQKYIIKSKHSRLATIWGIKQLVSSCSSRFRPLVDRSLWARWGKHPKSPQLPSSILMFICLLVRFITTCLFTGWSSFCTPCPMCARVQAAEALEVKEVHLFFMHWVEIIIETLLIIFDVCIPPFCFNQI